jgi:serine/threonine protein kinase
MDDQRKVILKCIAKAVELIDPKIIELFKLEATCLSLIENPHVVKIIETMESNDYYYTVLEYCNEGTLSQLLE